MLCLCVARERLPLQLALLLLLLHRLTRLWLPFSSLFALVVVVAHGCDAAAAAGLCVAQPSAWEA